MTLEEQSGVYTGSREAVLKAAVDLLAAQPPPMCRPAANKSPLNIAVGMKEVHAWSRLQATAAWWLGEHANQACSEQCWCASFCVCLLCLLCCSHDMFALVDDVCQYWELFFCICFVAVMA